MNKKEFTATLVKCLNIKKKKKFRKSFLGLLGAFDNISRIRKKISK